jgi:glyoxylase-like metal-dependent hydrolase (beta-lactamase superfamily II)
MPIERVVPGLHRIAIGSVNAYLIESDAGLTLVDTGYPGKADLILGAIQSLGRPPADVRSIVVTHCHIDHAGSLADLKRRTGAEAWMHPIDASMVRLGNPMRPLKPAPGVANWVIGNLILRFAPKELEASEIEHEVADGEILPVGGGLRAIHVPGHCAGQVALLWPHQGGVLLAADAAATVMGLGLSPLYEDLSEGRRSLARLSELDFEVACFGHGKPILRGASDQFRRKWPANSSVLS